MGKKEGKTRRITYALPLRLCEKAQPPFLSLLALRTHARIKTKVEADASPTPYFHPARPAAPARDNSNSATKDGIKEMPPFVLASFRYRLKPLTSRTPITFAFSPRLRVPLIYI